MQKRGLKKKWIAGARFRRQMGACMAWNCCAAGSPRRAAREEYSAPAASRGAGAGQGMGGSSDRRCLLQTAKARLSRPPPPSPCIPGRANGELRLPSAPVCPPGDSTRHTALPAHRDSERQMAIGVMQPPWADLESTACRPPGSSTRLASWACKAWPTLCPAASTATSRFCDRASLPLFVLPGRNAGDQ